MITIQHFFDDQEKITQAFLSKRDSAPKNFWCHTKEATEFYSYWDKKWNIIQKYFQKRWDKISSSY